MRYIYLLLFFTVSLLSCSYKNEWKHIRAGSNVEVEIPDYMSVSTKLRDGALLQYENQYRNIYFLIIKHDAANTNLQDLTTNCLKPFMVYLEKPVITDTTTSTLNGMPVRITKLMGEMPSGDGKESIYYIHYVIQGKNNFYELSSWTRGPNRYAKYGNDMLRMLNSFKEL